MNKEIIKNAIKDGGSMLGAGKKLGMTKYHFERIAKKFKLWAPNQCGAGKSKKRSIGFFKLADIFNGKHPQYSTNTLKQRLISEGIKANKCEICSVSEWMGKELTCQLDHINGVSNDHRLENLRIVCPNCHSQTDTFCGKNKGKIQKLLNTKQIRVQIDNINI